MTEDQRPEDDQQLTPDKEPSADVQKQQAELDTPAFSVADVKADLSYFLRTEHALPAVTVKYLVERFMAATRRERGDSSLGALFAELSEEIRSKRGELSPGYLALVDYVNKKVSAPAPRVSPVPAIAPAETSGISEVVALTSLGAGMVFPEEVPSSVRVKMPLVMEMSLDEAIRAFFPSVSDVLLQAIRLKMIQGPSQDEAGTLDWQERYFIDLVSRFDSLRSDLEALDVSIGSAARLLVGRGQQEANRATSARASSSRRGELPTLVGVAVDKVQLAIAIERVQAGLPLVREGAPTDEAPEDATKGTTATDDQDIAISTKQEPADTNEPDFHTRITAIPPAPVTPATVDLSLRATVTNEVQREAPVTVDEILTVPVDTREVRARLETVQHIVLAPAAQPTEIPKAPKSALVSSLRRLFRRDDEDKK